VRHVAGLKKMPRERADTTRGRIPAFASIARNDHGLTGIRKFRFLSLERPHTALQVTLFQVSSFTG